MKEKQKVAIELRYKGTVKRFEIDDDTFTIGRLDSLKVHFHDCTNVSREHLKVTVKGDQIFITDLGSTNGTHYAGKRISAQTPVAYHKEALCIGSMDDGVLVRIAFKDDLMVQSTSTYTNTLRQNSPAQSTTTAQASVVKATTSSHAQPAESLSSIVDPDILLRASAEVHNKRKEAAELSVQLEAIRVEVKGLEIERDKLYELVGRITEKEEEERRILRVVDELKETEKTHHNTVRDLDSLIQERETQEKNIAARILDLKDAERTQEKKVDTLERTVAEKLRQEHDLDKTLESLRKNETSFKEEIDDLTEQLHIVKENHSSEKKKLEKTTKQLNEKDEQERNLAAKIDELKKKEAATHKALTELTSQVDKSEKSIEHNKFTLDKEKAKLAEITQNISDKKHDEQALMRSIDELHRKESLAKATALENDHQIDKKKKMLAHLQAEYDDVKSSLDSVEHDLQAARDKVADQRNQVETEGNELTRKIEEHRKKVKLETETLDAEMKLAKTHVECEIEELKTKKFTLDRECETLTDKLARLQTSMEQLSDVKSKTETTVQDAQTHLNAMRSETNNLEQKKTDLEKEVSNLGKRLQEAEAQTKEMKEAARLEAIHLMEESRAKVVKEKDAAIEEVQKFKTATENELARQEKDHSENLAQERKRLENEIEKHQKELESEQTQTRNKIAQDADNATRAWKDELSKNREKDAEAIRLWKASEETRVREIFSNEMKGFSHQVAVQTLTEFSNEKQISVSTLLSSLEKKLEHALHKQAVEKGFYNPNLKVDTQKFWAKAAASVAALIALGFGYVYGPEFIKEKLAILKAANQQENENFMREVREQRARMLALHLEARVDFQNHYVDNILYNPGYLAMKVDEQIQKEWTVELSHFFFQELKFDDRKVVEFLPIETSMIRGMADIDKVLNSKNFDVNVPLMKKIEEEKVEQMWLAVGGRENWVKLRNREAAFYAKHVGADTVRIPASAGVDKK